MVLGMSFVLFLMNEGNVSMLDVGLEVRRKRRSDETRGAVVARDVDFLRLAPFLSFIEDLIRTPAPGQ